MTSKIKEFPGTPLSEKDFEKGHILHRLDKMEAWYAWDTGIAIRTYLAALQEGVLLGGYCATCRKTVIPPRTVCEPYVSGASGQWMNTFRCRIRAQSIPIRYAM
jgi:hypothetical protein